MATALLLGAAVGSLFGELQKAVHEMKDKAALFKPTLELLQTKLTEIDPIVKEMEQQNSELGRPKEELQSLISKIKEAKKLVLNCTKIPRLHYFARNRHQVQLAAVMGWLTSFFTINMNAQKSRDVKEILILVRRLPSGVTTGPGETDSVVEPNGNIEESKSTQPGDDASPVLPNHRDYDNMQETLVDSSQSQSQRSGVDAATLWLGCFVILVLLWQIWRFRGFLLWTAYTLLRIWFHIYLPYSFPFILADLLSNFKEHIRSRFHQPNHKNERETSESETLKESKSAQSANYKDMLWLNGVFAVFVFLCMSGSLCDFLLRAACNCLQIWLPILLSSNLPNFVKYIKSHTHNKASETRSVPNLEFPCMRIASPFFIIGPCLTIVGKLALATTNTEINIESKSTELPQPAGTSFEQVSKDITNLTLQIYQFLGKLGDLSEDGDELLTWALDPPNSLSHISITMRAEEVVSKFEALSVLADDLKQVASKFHSLYNIINYQCILHTTFYSKKWRVWAACYIQAAWRRYQSRKLSLRRSIGHPT